jgi:hypothetical protein
VTKRFLASQYGADAELKTQRIDEGGIDGDLCAVVLTQVGASILCEQNRCTL